MKKFKKIILTLMTILAILAMNFLGLVNSVNAADSGRNIQLQNEGDCGALLKFNGSQVITVYVTYNSSNGNTYPAYCLNRDLKGVGKVDAYAVSANDYVTDVGLWRRIINGYPYKTIEELGCANKYEAFTATKQAIYCYIHGNNPEDYEAIGETGERTLNALKIIVANAQNSTETKLETSLSIEKNTTEWTEDTINTEYVSKIYSIKANADFKKYLINIEKTEKNELPKGIKIVDLNNKEKTEFNKGEKFKIIIPIQSLTQDGTFKINVKSELKTKPIIYGTAPNPEYQDYALTGFEYENGEGNIEDDYKKIEKKEEKKEEEKPKEEIKPVVKKLPKTGM